MRTRAAILETPVPSIDAAGGGPATIEEIEVDDPIGEEVLVEIAAASLCHTDVSIALGHLERPTPLVLGHEGAGVVRAVGDDVESVSPGDHVVLGRVACRKCEYCRIGRSNLCRVRTDTMFEGAIGNGSVKFSRDGETVYHCHGVSSFTTHTVVTEDVAVPITDAIPLEEATLLGCGVFTGVGAVTNTADIEAGASVVVFGCGGVGLSAIQGAAMRAAGEIIAVDVVAEKLTLAADVGATHTVDASTQDPVEAVRTYLDGGADYSFDAVGNETVIEQAIEMLAPLGTAVVIGTGSGEVAPSFNISGFVTSEKRLLGSFNGSYDLRSAIPTLAELVVDGHLSLGAMITDTWHLGEINEAMASLEAGTNVRQVILPD